MSHKQSFARQSHAIAHAYAMLLKLVWSTCFLIVQQRNEKARAPYKFKQHGMRYSA